ncbi:unnamed protein product [Prorocentrum cordatum]|uniref:Uncharacterized protein n=1 Tax=Prorocentrum cordatum TaxID=2364126 RepID=A0ABN9XP04_9DINO|nr:unnamed protein product [Polarella glacialis]
MLKVPSGIGRRGKGLGGAPRSSNVEPAAPASPRGSSAGSASPSTPETPPGRGRRRTCQDTLALPIVYCTSEPAPPPRPWPSAGPKAGPCWWLVEPSAAACPLRRPG